MKKEIDLFGLGQKKRKDEEMVDRKKARKGHKTGHTIVGPMYLAALYAMPLCPLQATITCSVKTQKLWPGPRKESPASSHINALVYIVVVPCTCDSRTWSESNKLSAFI